jgi:transposase
VTSTAASAQIREPDPDVASEVIGGADTHADTIHVAVISVLGREVADEEFPTTPSGYRAAIAFLSRHGRLEQVGVEGTSSYGAGLATALSEAGLAVVEVNRPDRAQRRRRGKSDPLDAYQAARAVLSGQASSTPKDPSTEAIRSLHNARRSAIKARTATMNQIIAMLVTAPGTIRTKYRALKEKSLITALARCRPDTHRNDPLHTAVTTSLKTLAQRYQFLTEQADDLNAQIDELATVANPGLRAAYGVGPDTAAQLLITAGANPDRLRSEASFAALCGTAPVPASSGKTRGRHRLSRGGDRAANSALYRIALVRLSSHAPTRAYASRQKAAGRSSKDILRMLKRAIAREIYRYLTQQIDVPEYHDLRPTRQAKSITVTAAAQHFGLWPTTISRLERGLQRDDDLAHRYRTWLTTA